MAPSLLKKGTYPPNRPLKRGRGLPETASSSQSSDDFEEGSSQDGLAEDDVDLEDDDADADAPRVSQWEADDELLYEAESEVAPVAKASKLLDLEGSLKHLPLGALRKAQNVLTRVEVDSDEDDDSEDESPSDEESLDPARGKVKERVQWVSKDTTNKKRANKHAPIEVTSKRPVSRNRVVVDVPKIVPRDPRFLPVAGEFKPEQFQKSYAFLVESHKTELSTLRENLQRARKVLSTSPSELRAEREAEVERLEQAVRRTESLVNKDRQDAIQREALNRVAKEEREKRKQGKGNWWMKKGERREVINRARFEALTTEGGRGAVKKAIDKKQKKIGQKEKKSRPYAKGAFKDGSFAERRPPRIGTSEAQPSKRRKIS